MEATASLKKPACHAACSDCVIFCWRGSQTARLDTTAKGITAPGFISEAFRRKRRIVTAWAAPTT
eukprot:5281652-Pyramimonas_sp.AAC.1